MEQIDWIIFACGIICNLKANLQSTLYLWHLNAGGTTAVVLSQSFFEKYSLFKNEPKIVFFSLFWKMLSFILLEMYLKKNWNYSQLTSHDLRFTTRFWISTTELFVILNSFMITERKKSQWIYQWIWDIQIQSNLFKQPPL